MAFQLEAAKLGRARRIAFESLEDRRLLSATTLSEGLAATASISKIDNDLALISTGFSGASVQASLSATEGIVADYSLWQWRDDSIGISALASSDGEDLAHDLALLGMQSASISGAMVTGFLPMTAIGSLSVLESLRFAQPALKAITNVGLTTSGGDVAQRSQVVRSFDALTGAGVHLGLISDSYNTSGVGSAATDVSSGDLPGIGNPNGFTTPVTVLRDNVSGTDEGRAMLQIVHDVAPGAQLLFSNVADGSGVQSEQAFAQNIRDLRDAGADIIVDDLLFVREPFFMDGVVSQAVDEVVGDGVTYFSAAGNDSNDSYELNFNSSGLTENFTLNSVTRSELLHDFDPGVGVDTRQRITIPSGASQIILQWDDPFITVAPTSGGATRDFDIYLLSTSGTIISGGVSTTIGGDPVEVFSVSSALGSSVDIVIGLRNGANPGGHLKYYVHSSGAAADITQYDTNSATVYGHANSAGAIGVGATYYRATPEFGVNPASVENFSAVGGVDILFDTSGNRLMQADQRSGVDIVAPDGGNTTFFGRSDPTGTGLYEADGFRNFFGTSAAAPHAAAVAALLLQADPTLTPSEIETVLEDSAFDMDDPYTAGFQTGQDSATGHGFIDTLGAIGLVTDVPLLVGLAANEYILVNDTRDLLDANAGDGVVDIDLGMAGQQVSLRAAVVAANTGTGNATTLLMPKNQYVLSLSGSGSAAQGDLDILSSMKIIGAGAGETIISAGGDSGILDRVFEVVGSGQTLTLDSLTVTGGRAPLNQPTGEMHGGGIFVRSGATLDLRNSVVVDNKTRNAAEGLGGGIYFERSGGHFITNSVITNNHSAYFTGGVYLGVSGTGPIATVTVTRSIIANNTAAQSGSVDLATANPQLRPFVSGGYNRLGNPAAGFADNVNGDYIKPPGTTVHYIVTGLADTYNSGDDVRVLSLREAINKANMTSGPEEIWVPAWKFLLTRERDFTDPAQSTDTSVGYGDLDISQSLTIRGVNGYSSVAWRIGAVADAVFDLLGDYNGDGIANGTDNGSVGSDDYVVWRNTLGSTTDLRADGDDNGVIEQADYYVWIAHFGNTLTLLGV